MSTIRVEGTLDLENTQNNGSYFPAFIENIFCTVLVIFTFNVLPSLDLYVHGYSNLRSLYPSLSIVRSREVLPQVIVVTTFNGPHTSGGGWGYHIFGNQVLHAIKNWTQLDTIRFCKNEG